MDDKFRYNNNKTPPPLPEEVKKAQQLLLYENNPSTGNKPPYFNYAPLKLKSEKNRLQSVYSAQKILTYDDTISNIKERIH